MSCIYRILILLHVIDSENIKIFVLDETDELLSRGFNEQIQDIFTLLRDTVQVIVASATMPGDVLEITTKLMKDPLKILVKREERTLDGIRQFYVNIEREVDIHTRHTMMMMMN